MGWAVKFKNDSLEKLERDRNYQANYPPEICKMFRKRMQQIRAATDERDFYAMKSLRYEKLKGKRSHQHSMRLNDQWRLIIEIDSEGQHKILWICDIEDYH